MYLMYVDESGDTGLANSPTRHFVLSGLVVHELRWQACLEQLIEFRRRMKAQFGVRLRDEIHSAHSYFIQAADLVAFLLYQFLSPCAYFRKKGATYYFKMLDPVLCKIASSTDPFGIVRL